MLRIISVKLTSQSAEYVNFGVKSLKSKQRPLARPIWLLSSSLFGRSVSILSVLPVPVFFHQIPVHHSAVAGNAEEFVLLCDVRIHVDLINWIRIFLGPHVGLIDSSFVIFLDVVDKNTGK
jgi:hypothetical protein